MSDPLLYGKVADLRRAFDQAFSAAPAAADAELEDLITVQIAGKPHALRAREISGLFLHRSVLKVPTRRSELLGIAGIRSALVPIYDLAALLELGQSTSASPWIAVCDSLEPLGLSFQSLEGLLRVAKNCVSEATLDTASGLPRSVLRVNDQTYPIVEVGLLVKKLKGLGTLSEPGKDR
jgi:chemotaxis signal transduction protein